MLMKIRITGFTSFFHSEHSLISFDCKHLTLKRIRFAMNVLSLCCMDSEVYRILNKNYKGNISFFYMRSNKIVKNSTINVTYAVVELTNLLV